MPSPILTRKRPLTQEEWIILLEEGRKKLVPAIRKYSFPNLHDLQWLYTADCDTKHSLHDVGYVPETTYLPDKGSSGGAVNQKTNRTGVFGFSPSPFPNPGTRYVWGLTRQRKLLLMEATTGIATIATHSPAEICLALRIQTATWRDLFSHFKPVDIYETMRGCTHTILSAMDQRLFEFQRDVYDPLRSNAEAIHHTLPWSTHTARVDTRIPISEYSQRDHARAEILGVSDDKLSFIVHVYYNPDRDSVCPTCARMFEIGTQCSHCKEEAK